MRFVELSVELQGVSYFAFSAIIPQGMAEKIQEAAFPDDGWRTEVRWTVEAEGFEEAVKKIAEVKKEAEEAHLRLEEFHQDHLAKFGTPMRCVEGGAFLP